MKIPNDKNAKYFYQQYQWWDRPRLRWWILRNQKNRMTK